MLCRKCFDVKQMDFVVSLDQCLKYIWIWNKMVLKPWNKCAFSLFSIRKHLYWTLPKVLKSKNGIYWLRPKDCWVNGLRNVDIVPCTHTLNLWPLIGAILSPLRAHIGIINILMEVSRFVKSCTIQNSKPDTLLSVAAIHEWILAHSCGLYL